jgi:hypothetical protein
MNYARTSVGPANGTDGRSPAMATWRYRKTVTMVGRKHNMMIDIATVGEFTASTNSTDVTVKMPMARMACKTAKITTPSCCRDLLGGMHARMNTKCLTREASTVAAMCRLMVYNINVRVATVRVVDPVID